MYNIDQHVPKPDSVVLRTVQDGVLGCSMGMLATCFNAPFDVVSKCSRSLCVHAFRTPGVSWAGKTVFGRP